MACPMEFSLAGSGESGPGNAVIAYPISASYVRDNSFFPTSTHYLFVRNSQSMQLIGNMSVITDS